MLELFYLEYWAGNDKKLDWVWADRFGGRRDTFIRTGSCRRYAGQGMPVKALVPVPAFIDWSGVYIGVHAGYGGGMKDYSSQADFVARGFLGGGQVGINKQISSFVFGLELDGSWANIKGSQLISLGGPLLGLQASQTAVSKVDGLVTFAGRAGLAADRWFVFAKAGIALHPEPVFAAAISAINGGHEADQPEPQEERCWIWASQAARRSSARRARGWGGPARWRCRTGRSRDRSRQAV